MKLTFFTLLSFALAAFMLPDDNCGKDPLPVQGNLYDGPYVQYMNGLGVAKYVLDDNGFKSVRVDTFSAEHKGRMVIQVATDEPGKTFSVQLKKELATEKSEFSDVKKMFILSDIEGNFHALRTLLQANGVINEKLDWTFGTGHLVLTGDFFDRGIQVTEVLWLIYSLEEKAKADGGYVHFILGNHEIMNLSGDYRYVHQKYMENAVLLKEDYRNFFGTQSELGQWLRTKNVVEKIGDMLFAHGGISAAVNSSDISVSRINKLARPYYTDSTFQYKDPKVELLYSEVGPFWYRGYYMDKAKASQSQVDSTLSLYKVKYIATGHTIVADTVSVHFNGKVFDTDVHHAKGHSEGLLYENGNFYRASLLGEKLQIAE
jgi:Calcineurin-like phosphoesterase